MEQVAVTIPAAAATAAAADEPPCGTGGLPEAVAEALAPAVAGPADAERRTRQLAHSHYENFSVVSLLLPRALRQDFCNIYAFCRVADDLGDELGDRDASAAALASLREKLLACHAGDADAVLFVALRETLRRHAIPPEPFLDLIDAFEQDQRVTRYATYAELLDYCRRSANPVGRLVLYLSGYGDAERQRLSDATCTALQLANFWQDVRRDLLDRDRVYLPAEDMARFGVTEADLRAGIDAGRCGPAYAELVGFEVEPHCAAVRRGGRAAAAARRRRPRPGRAVRQGRAARTGRHPRPGVRHARTAAGPRPLAEGQARAVGPDVQAHGPAPATPARAGVPRMTTDGGGLSASFDDADDDLGLRRRRRCSAPPRCHGRMSGVGSPSAAADVSLARSRAYCERLTRAKARNFYYGLRLLPEPKRSDMFALYAYMRLIDDIADDDDIGETVRRRSRPRCASHPSQRCEFCGRPDRRRRTPDQRERDLEARRVVTAAVLRGDARFAAGAGHEAWPAFADMARRNRLPAQPVRRRDRRPAAGPPPGGVRDVRRPAPLLLPRRRHGRPGQHPRLGLRRRRGHAPARRRPRRRVPAHQHPARPPRGRRPRPLLPPAVRPRRRRADGRRPAHRPVRRRRGIQQTDGRSGGPRRVLLRPLDGAGVADLAGQPPDAECDDGDLPGPAPQARRRPGPRAARAGVAVAVQEGADRLRATRRARQT